LPTEIATKLLLNTSLERYRYNIPAWLVTTCSSEDYYLASEEYSWYKMEAADTSETPVTTNRTRRNHNIVYQIGIVTLHI
jgi:hypothetical protein